MTEHRQRRPRDAAGILLLRTGASGVEVLMGRRQAEARFMPGLYVFPGGRLDASDRRSSGFQETFAHPHSSLDAASRREHDAYVRAALRELYEETGFLFGRKAALLAEERRPPVWHAYHRAGLRPLFEDLVLFARAITPANRPIRFHTRFFLARESSAPLRVGTGDGELEDIGWKPAGAVLGDLPTPGITKKVLHEALAARQAPGSYPPVRYTARRTRLYLRRQASPNHA